MKYKKLSEEKRKNLIKIIRMFRSFAEDQKQFYYPIIKSYMDELKEKKFKVLHYYRYLK